MADISKEIQAFQTAVYGEEVRSSMVSLCEKVNDEVEATTSAEATFETTVNATVDSYKNSVDAQIAALSALQNTVTIEHEQNEAINKQAIDSANRAQIASTNTARDSKKAEASAVLAESYAKGNTNSREYEDIDNAKYYSDAARSAKEESTILLADANDILEMARKEVSGYNFFVKDEDGCLYVNSEVKTTKFGIDELDGYLYVEVA